MKVIRVQGAKTHNLKNITVEIPRDQLVVITGLSGSGKSSLAFDTLYAEGQRRYVESLSAYARQFLSMMDKPDVEHIEGLSPAIAIEQKSTSHNPRSTVGTVTEIYDYLRLLYARVGVPHCPEHQAALNAQTVTEMVDQVLSLPEGTKIMVLAPVVNARKGTHEKLFLRLKSDGFLRVIVNDALLEIDEVPALDKNKKHTVSVVVDRLKVRDALRLRLSESFETALRLAEGVAHIAFMDDLKRVPLVFSENFSCPHCGYSLEQLEPRLFSFNSPSGACPTCDGLGVEAFFDEDHLIIDKTLSLSDGALYSMGKQHRHAFEMLSCLAEHYGFDLDQPFEMLDDTIKNVLLRGSGKERIKFTYHGFRGRLRQKTHAFEGLIPSLTKRYHESDSQAVREELSKYLTTAACSSCQGSRLCLAARHVLVGDTSITQVVEWPVTQALSFFKALKMDGWRQEVTEKIVKEIIARFQFLADVGLAYLNLSRSAETLSGGEAQRIRLASQIGAGLVGVMYVLDEPSIGLHQRDNARLLNTLVHLRELGNTVLVVEHDEEAIRVADWVLDMGPGAGVHGGSVVFEGPPSELLNAPGSLTGAYLSGRRSIMIPTSRVAPSSQWLQLEGAQGHNLKSVDLMLPVGLFSCITGVSGSGKSTLINETLYPIVARTLNRATLPQPAPYKKITGLEHLDKVVQIDQSPIGRTPRSNPATYTGIFTGIRELFARVPEARSRGYKAGRFSFNVKGGRCEACQGDGVIKVEMHFLPDVYVVCDLCQGKRYNRETLEIEYKGQNIYQVLDMTIEAACEFFDAIPAITRRLQTLMDVGLGYIKLGQSATTLSGGEAQRVKLSRELSKRDTGKTLYLLDEPTTGLHFADIEQLLSVLMRLRDRGNTLIVIEHNLDVIKTADWVVDLGPDGGQHGGEIIASGSPEDVAEISASYTGHYLKKILPVCEKEEEKAT